MNPPTHLYKQFYQFVPLNEMTGLQWFALTPEYGSSYGPIHKKYRFKRSPKLLDIGNADVRTMIEETIAPFDPEIMDLSDPNIQYSGGEFNKKYHRLVQKFFGDLYDGTIIDENHLQGNTKYSAEDLEGPSEVVLWKNYPELLEEISSNGSGFGGRIKRKKTMKKNKTKRRIQKTRKERKHKEKSRKERKY